MPETAGSAGQRTPLYTLEQRHGAKFISWAGWEMPLQFSGIIAEHRAVRAAAGVFDLSNMGEVEISGQGSLELLQEVMTSDIISLNLNEMLYTVMCHPEGTILDTPFVMRLGAQYYLLLVNPRATDQVTAWLRERAPRTVTVRDASNETGLLSIEGRYSQAVLQPLVEVDLSHLGYLHWQQAAVNGKECVIARASYSGEDGFSLFCNAEDMAGLWETLLSEGKHFGVVPVGLGARNTLRLEVGLPMVTREITPDTNPFEVGLGWTVRFRKSRFVGRDALWSIKTQGPARQLVGIEVLEGGVPGTGAPLYGAAMQVGHITSASYGPSVNKTIALGFVNTDLARPGVPLLVETKGQRCRCAISALPFYHEEANPPAGSSQQQSAS